VSRRRDEVDLWRTWERMVAPRRRTPRPIGLWNWRKELLILAVAAFLCTAVAGTFGLLWMVAGISALVGMCMMPWSPRSRSYFWQLVTPHLLRSGLYHAGIQNRSGRIPLIVRVTREPFGERVRLRCPAGICAEDIDFERETLRAACRCSDVRVMRDELRAHIVTVDVVRRYGDSDDADGGYPDLLAGRR
jgi:hypothetical protein